MEQVDSLQLDSQEAACSICTVTFAEDPNEYFAVGTAFVLPDESEPTRVSPALLLSSFCAIRSDSKIRVQRTSFGSINTYTKQMGHGESPVSLDIRDDNSRGPSHFDLKLCTLIYGIICLEGFLANVSVCLHLQGVSLEVLSFWDRQVRKGSILSIVKAIHVHMKSLLDPCSANFRGQEERESLFSDNNRLQTL